MAETKTPTNEGVGAVTVVVVVVVGEGVDRQVVEVRRDGVDGGEVNHHYRQESELIVRMMVSPNGS